MPKLQIQFTPASASSNEELARKLAELFRKIERMLHDHEDRVKNLEGS